MPGLALCAASIFQVFCALRSCHAQRCSCKSVGIDCTESMQTLLSRGCGLLCAGSAGLALVECPLISLPSGKPGTNLTQPCQLLLVLPLSTCLERFQGMSTVGLRVPCPALLRDCVLPRALPLAALPSSIGAGRQSPQGGSWPQRQPTTARAGRLQRCHRRCRGEPYEGLASDLNATAPLPRVPSGSADIQVITAGTATSHGAYWQLPVALYSLPLKLPATNQPAFLAGGEETKRSRSLCLQVCTQELFSSFRFSIKPRSSALAR